MKAPTEAALKRATRAKLTEALLSACQELAEEHHGHDMFLDEAHGYVAAGTLNNQVVKHLMFADTVFED